MDGGDRVPGRHGARSAGTSLTVLIFGRIWLPAGHAAVAMCACAGGAAITATVAELLKAHGNPAPLIRINLVSAIVSALAVLALVPLGLSAAAAGLSVGALAGGVYALRTVLGQLDVSIANLRREIWPPVVAATLMALALLPLDRLLLRPASHGLVLGLLLLVGRRRALHRPLRGAAGSARTALLA